MTPLKQSFAAGVLMICGLLLLQRAILGLGGYVSHVRATWMSSAIYIAAAVVAFAAGAWLLIASAKRRP